MILGDTSVAGSEFSDTNIDVNILYEISELRREEGASSPSNCSIDSDSKHLMLQEMVPPDVCIWHPQSWTYNIDLITYFRATSPCQEVTRVLIPKEYVELTVKAPQYEETETEVELLRKFPHSGAFARRRGARCIQRSLSVPDYSKAVAASKNESACVDLNFINAEPEEELCIVECITGEEERLSLNCQASTIEHAFFDYEAKNLKQNHQCCLTQCVDRHQQSISLKAKAANNETCLLNDSVANAKQETLSCLIEVNDSQSLIASLRAKAPTVENCDIQTGIQHADDGVGSCYVKLDDHYFASTVLISKGEQTKMLQWRMLFAS
ncbi:unnamed protein product [Strongylus vulgaris]|uniref:Uncharacterized protein n=1 Tax=Strongylus vulgaris TaxID=40348 RepID=A0A3P7I170_STRVU|nr:unnamed protein product [Strongylus vulgaris]